MSDRFILADEAQAKQATNAEDWLYGWDDDIKTFLIDTWTGEVVFADGFEPEDCTLGRAFSPLVDMLNLAYAGQDDA